MQFARVDDSESTTLQFIGLLNTGNTYPSWKPDDSYKSHEIFSRTYLKSNPSQTLNGKWCSLMRTHQEFSEMSTLLSSSYFSHPTSTYQNYFYTNAENEKVSLNTFFIDSLSSHLNYSLLKRYITVQRNTFDFYRNARVVI